MTDYFERYHCQMALPGFGKSAQQLLQKARVLIVGAGGLGCPAAQYLAAAGIGTICIADDDTVAESNLHRQLLYTPQDLGLLKAEVASKKLQQQNPSANLISYPFRITASNIMELIAEVDLVIEGTDNFETKYLLNDACVLSGRPLIYGAIYQYEGQMSIWNVLQQDGSYSPNYRDAFPDAEKAQVPNCAKGGVIPTLAGIVGCMQANEAIKYFTGAEELLAGKLWMINARDGSTRIIHLKKRPDVKITELPVTVATISFTDLQQASNHQLIDVRTKKEHEHFNIGGKNIPLDELSDHLDGLSFSGPVICYCASGSRSAIAVRLIKEHFPDVTVYSLKGGIEKIIT
ncbi:thiamine biosynthesis protein [Niabella ginsenosidivorans]|uniref:Thiamine biosynthesis protein n=2 Tax=Niabella ginsenosidivorans TaxID=1176587 RepID=A0A1A9I1E3_9BACT|nr:thiamine biosynthesis protein [Niabella ginsenosidivorans]